MAPKPDPKPDDMQVVDSKPQKRTPATSINFNKELNLPFPTLHTLGTARRGRPQGLRSGGVGAVGQ